MMYEMTSDDLAKYDNGIVTKNLDIGGCTTKKINI